MMFDINDFDETLPGPWEWDVKRLAASLEIAGRDRGFTPAERRAIVLAMADEYRTRIKQTAGMHTWPSGTPTSRLRRFSHSAGLCHQKAGGQG
jgi:uncharacterized protein (DUF2252 family)